METELRKREKQQAGENPAGAPVYNVNLPLDELFKKRKKRKRLVYLAWILVALLSTIVVIQSIIIWNLMSNG